MSDSESVQVKEKAIAGTAEETVPVKSSKSQNLAKEEALNQQPQGKSQGKEMSRSNSTAFIKLTEEDDTLTALPNPNPQSSTNTAISLGNTAIKKKDLIRPLFSRSSTTDKMTKPNSTGNKTMTVETETVDASNVPSVTLPIGSNQNVVSNNDIMSNNSTISNNMSSLRSKKSTLFIDQGSQIIPNNSNNLNASAIPSDDPNLVPNVSNAVNSNDSASVNGSIRGLKKRLNQQETHTNFSSKPGATKADFFAAKIANAVGDASDSDSEETFVYESAPDALNTTNSAKAASGNINSNSLALRKLSQRNISAPMPSAATSSNLNNPATVNSLLAHNTSNLTTVCDINSTMHITTTTDNDESDSQLSQQNHSPRLNQIASDKDESSSQHLSHNNNNGSQTSISDHTTVLQAVPDSQQNEDSVIASSSLTDPQSSHHPLSKSTSEPVQLPPLHQPKTRVFTKYNGEQNVRKPSSISLLSHNKNAISGTPSNQLRTTTSKLFDNKGSSLRRYSGVPDDVNIEDYIDQYDEEEEVGLDDYSDTYDHEDYEEDELTPFNISKANSKLRNKGSKNYFNRNSFPNYNQNDTGEVIQGYNFGSTLKDESFQGNTKTKTKRYRNRSQHQPQSLQQPYSPHNFYNAKKQTRVQIFKNFMYLFLFVFLLLAFGFTGGFLLATTKDLQNVTITSIKDVVVSYDELIFDVYVEALNPGFITVSIDDVELDVFARTEYLDSSSFETSVYVDDPKDLFDEFGKPASFETVLLGSVSRFEVPLVFPSKFFKTSHSLSKGSIKLIHPGQNSTDTDDDEKEDHISKTDSDKWKEIIKHPFDLILKGRLKYGLPFFGSERSVAVTKSVSIDPAGKQSVGSPLLP